MDSQDAMHVGCGVAAADRTAAGDAGSSTVAEMRQAAGDPAQPEISVIVPVYHVEETLGRALDSLLCQTFPDFEIVLVNDGGTPEETAICEEYARRDARIVYVCQENQGLSGARNTGLRLSRGRWIMFLDTDDWVHREFCEKALESVTSTGADIGVFDLLYTNGDTEEGTPHRSELEEGVYSGYRALEERIRGGLAGYVWNKIYRRELWDAVEFPVGELWEDDAVLHEILDKADTVAIIHDILYFKGYREDSITAQASRDASDAYWVFIQRRRRWEYLAQHRPELLPAATQNMATTLVLYGRACLFVTHDSQAFDEAREWARRVGLSSREMMCYTAIRYWAFLHSKPLFRLCERLVLFLMRAGVQPPKKRR